MAIRRSVAVVLVLAALAAFGSPSMAASASWLTRLLREAAEGGVQALKHGPGGLEQAVAALRRLPVMPKGGALAATVSPEGHWTFMNAASEAFTAGTPDELKRVSQILQPSVAAAAKMMLLLTEEAVFEGRTELAKLPGNSDLRLVAGEETFPLLRHAGAADRYLAEIRPNLIVDLTEQRLFREMQWQLSRRLDRVKVRVLALEPGGPPSLSSSPRLEETTGRALTDLIDPYKLADAFGAVAGQTVVVAGRIDGRLIHFRPSTGPERSIDFEGLLKAAEASDVNLIVLQSSTARQPGARNWLWQRVTVAGLDDGVGRATFSDFLNALAEGQNRMLLTAVERANGRISMRALPLGGADFSPTSGGVGEMLSGIVSEVTGRVVTSAIEADMTGSERQRDLDARLIRQVPADLQFGYLGLLLAGLMGLPVALVWWRRLWPPEQREGYAGGFGYHAAGLVRLVCLVLIFLPLAGAPAFACNLVLQAWNLLVAPLRIWRRLSAPAAQARKLTSDANAHSA